LIRSELYQPHISVIIVACNEADCILNKLENLLASNYPQQRMEIIVASDGSTDATVARAQAESKDAPIIRVIDFKVQRGKSAVLNDVIPMARGEIVVLSDARQTYEIHALRKLVSRFSDPAVGAVSGDLVLIDADSRKSELGKGVDAYWKYEKFIRASEGRLDSVVGASGSIYAIRKAFFRPIPEDLILDDVLIPMQIMHRGYRVLFDPEARAYDYMSHTAEKEFSRKVRTIAGNFQLFVKAPWLLVPWMNRIWWQTVSHKACRLLSPVCLIMTFVTSVALMTRPAYAALVALQSLFYGAALFGYRARNRSTKRFLLNVPYTFCLLNWATVVAFYRFINGRQRVTWKMTQAR
jgi:poly-beta-1,6-N-acetyl-D-glucosamine synthase